MIAALLSLLLILCYTVSYDALQIEEEDLNLHAVEGPGVVLHKSTSGPLEPGSLGEDFPGTLPARFIRMAYGIDAPQTMGGRSILEGQRVCSSVSGASVGGDNGRGGEAEESPCPSPTEGDDADLDAEFGAALLSRAREMFDDRGLTDELDAFLRSSVSNPDAGHRRMHWVGIDIHPHHSLALHSHPNIEFAYIVEGVMHEWRLTDDDDSIEKKTVYVPEAVEINGTRSLRFVGPDLAHVDARYGTFRLNLYREGDMFINTIGDVHQSFTEGEGVKLFVMWGDGNADVPEDMLPQNAGLILNKQSAKAWT